MVSEEIFLSIFIFHFLNYGFHANQYKQAVSQKYIPDTGLFKEHFYKSFVKISAIA